MTILVCHSETRGYGSIRVGSSYVMCLSKQVCLAMMSESSVKLEQPRVRPCILASPNTFMVTEYNAEVVPQPGTNYRTNLVLFFLFFSKIVKVD